MKIKTGDKVRIISGANKGKEGKILQTFPRLALVVVEGINQRVKHLKGRGGKPGQKVEFAAPLPAANVRLIGAKLKGGRVGYKFLVKDNKKIKVRLLRQAGQTEDLE